MSVEWIGWVENVKLVEREKIGEVESIISPNNETLPTMTSKLPKTKRQTYATQEWWIVVDVIQFDSEISYFR